MFKLSERSLSRLEGVNPELVQVVKKAIEITKVDFGVIEGLRTLETQKEYFERGVSQTMKSKHLVGNAVDLMAYLGSRGSWEPTLYDDIADAMKVAAIQLNVPIKWGGAWQISDFRNWQGSAQEATDEYVALRRSQGRKPFVDLPHFETT